MHWRGSVLFELVKIWHVVLLLQEMALPLSELLGLLLCLLLSLLLDLLLGLLLSLLSS
jgi:hypothetical protein